MDVAAFTCRAGQLIERLTPRIDHRQAGFVRDDAQAREWDLALDNLIASLARGHIPIAARDDTDLRALLAHVGQPASRLNQITVAAPLTPSLDRATTDRFRRVALPTESTGDIVLRAALVGLDYLETHRAVRKILWAWDPGVASHAPRDEYDVLIEPVVRLLRTGADTATLTAWLRDRAETYFGLTRPVPCDNAEQHIADRLLRWWATRPPTSVPYPAPDHNI